MKKCISKLSYHQILNNNKTNSNNNNINNDNENKNNINDDT